MKRRLDQSITLWDAANIKDHKSMWHWWNWVRRRDYMSGEQTNCIERTTASEIKKMHKHQKLDDTKLMTTFTVGLKPTSNQKLVLNQMLRVSNHAYNYSNFLVREKNFKPVQKYLQSVVAKTNADSIPRDLRMEPEDDDDGSDVPEEQRSNRNDNWYFQNKLSAIKQTACKMYCTMHKSARSNQRRRDVTLKDKKYTREGSFQVQKTYVRFLKTKDTIDPKYLNRYICVLPESFGEKSNRKERFLKLAKPITKLPPIDHDVRISKRGNGKFVLQIPCDPSYTRQPISNDVDAICGIDPGGRTFATVYDPTNLQAFQVGLKEDSVNVLRKYDKKLASIGSLVSKAHKKEQKKVQWERHNQRAKLQHKKKTFVDDVHSKLSSHLVSSYKYVALGYLDVNACCRSKELSKQAKKDLRNWRHSYFRNRLRLRATETGRIVVLQDEAYTSRSCGRCGFIHNKLGSSETYNCPKCKYKTHRDINGARNILLKSLKQFPFD